MNARAYMYVIDPVYLAGSAPPNVNSPFSFDTVSVGSKDTPITSDRIVPCLNRLSVTVGMVSSLSGDKVPIVKSAGPTLGNQNVSADSKQCALHSPKDTVNILKAMGG